MVQRDGYHRVRVEVSPWTALSPPDRAWRRAARDSDRARARGGVRRNPRPYRDDGLFGRRTPRRHSRNPFRCGQGRRCRSDRSPQQPADFLILGYPVISFDPAVTHAGSVRNLLGDNPDPKFIEDLSNDLRVTPQTPPAFLFHTTNDNGVPVENSVRFYLALRKARVPAEMHLFENGPHGVGMALSDPALSAWPSLLLNWLRARGLLTKPNDPRITPRGFAPRTPLHASAFARSAAARPRRSLGVGGRSRGPAIPTPLAWASLARSFARLTRL